MDTFENFTGKFLVATSRMPDSRFGEHVILICSHSREEGAMGVAINRLHGRLQLEQLVFAQEIEGEVLLPDVYLGGPLGIDSGFILFEKSGAKDFTVSDSIIEVSSSLVLSRERTLLEDIIHGTTTLQHYLFVIGYAGWGRGQLEAELTRNGWLIVPADNNVIFRTPVDKRWQMAGSQYGIDITLFDDEMGNA